MLRRLLAVGFIAVAIAACGSDSSTGAPDGSSGDAPIVTPTEAATEAPIVEPTPGEPTTTTAACNAVGIRKKPTTDGALIVRVGAGTEVRVVETVVGDPYTAGNCGSAGDTWLKIDQVGGKDVETLYGITFAYTAGGFFR